MNIKNAKGATDLNYNSDFFFTILAYSWIIPVAKTSNLSESMEHFIEISPKSPFRKAPLLRHHNFCHAVISQKFQFQKGVGVSWRDP